MHYLGSAAGLKDAGVMSTAGDARGCRVEIHKARQHPTGWIINLNPELLKMCNNGQRPHARAYRLPDFPIIYNFL